VIPFILSLALFLWIFDKIFGTKQKQDISEEHEISVIIPKRFKETELKEMIIDG
jgi:sterol desaturase/sphingolipid hydroxylase (fatty acid hydroxylase superfamily)